MVSGEPSLGAFLRSRRDRLTPAQAGLAPGHGARRVPGLRREEVAVLAGVSADYLRRVEQGRHDAVSPSVLDALARALRLDEVERRHIHDLAAPSPLGGLPEPAGLPQRPEPGLLRVMDQLAGVPVMLLGRRAEVLARNGLLDAVLGRSLVPGTSFVRYLLQDPLARERIVNWPEFAAGSVAGLRREAGRHPGDRRLTALVEELRGADADVNDWWGDHTVRDHASMRKQVRHPVAGDMHFDIEPVISPWQPDQVLVIYTVEPGSATARALDLVAGWGLPTVDPREQRP